MRRILVLLTALLIPAAVLGGGNTGDPRTEQRRWPRKSGFYSFYRHSGPIGVGALPGAGCRTGTATQPADYAGNMRLDCDGESPHNETTIVVDPLNPDHAVGGYHAYLGESTGSTSVIRVVGTTSVTFDAGETWREVVPPIHPYQFTGDPALAFDSRGRLYFANIADHEGPGGNFTGPSVVVARSDDGGLSWSSPATVARGFTAITKGKRFGPNVFNDKDFIATDAGIGSPYRDRVYVTWTRFQDVFTPKRAFFTAPIFLSYSDDGVTWSPAKAISGFNQALCIARFFGLQGQCDVNQESYPAVAPSGRVYVSFTNFNTVAQSQILVTSSDDGGVTWGTPSRVDFIEDFNLPISANFEPVLTGCNFRLSFKANTAGDPADATGKTVYVVWSDNRNGGLDPASGNFVSNLDVFLGRSTDGGETWSVVPVNLSPNDQFFPWVAVAPDGRVDVGYMDRAYSSGQDVCRYGYSLTRLTFDASGNVAGKTQTRLDSALSDPGNSFWFGQNSAFIGDYSGIAVDAGGRTWAAWTDERSAVGPADSRKGQHAVAGQAP
mgnify:CR=1 FL=1